MSPYVTLPLLSLLHPKAVLMGSSQLVSLPHCMEMGSMAPSEHLVIILSGPIIVMCHLSVFPRTVLCTDVLGGGPVATAKSKPTVEQSPVPLRQNPKGVAGGICLAGEVTPSTSAQQNQ